MRTSSVEFKLDRNTIDLLIRNLSMLLRQPLQLIFIKSSRCSDGNELKTDLNLKLTVIDPHCYREATIKALFGRLCFSYITRFRVLLYFF